MYICIYIYIHIHDLYGKLSIKLTFHNFSISFARRNRTSGSTWSSRPLVMIGKSWWRALWRTLGAAATNSNRASTRRCVALVLQYVVVCCSVLQCFMEDAGGGCYKFKAGLNSEVCCKCVAVCCKCVAVCWMVSPCVSVRHIATYCDIVRHSAT